MKLIFYFLIGRILTSVFIIVGAILSPSLITAQSNESENIVHHFKNASFEEMVFSSHEGVPGWINCGPEEESPPTVHFGTELYNVTHEPQNGDQYISIVTRSHESWESFSQKLDIPLIADQNYEFSLYLAQAELKSHTRRSGSELMSFNRPITLRVWGGNNECQLAELLFTSEAVDHGEWKEYVVKIHPKKKMNWIIFESFYVIPALMPYNGNILIDNLSDIRMVN